MLGLRKPEGKKFERFFEIVQSEAKKKGFVFFLDSAQGKFFENEQLECEDLCGWLIPEEEAAAFEKLFAEGSEKQHTFDGFYCYIDFVAEEKTGKIRIIIDDTND